MMNDNVYKGITEWQGIREMPWNRPFKMSIFLYVVDGLLIDTGPSTLGQESIKFFKENNINQVALTHVHEDHSGMAAWLQEKFKIPVYLHEDSIAEAAVEPEFLKYRLEIWGRRPAFKAQTIPAQIETDKYCFQVIDTPGHYKHHKAFLESNQGWLFSGDLLVNTKPRSVFCEENMSEMINSLEKISTLDFDTVFCSHTGILKNGQQLCHQKLEYLLDLRAKVQEMRQQGLEDREIDSRLFPEEDKVGVLTDGDFSSFYIVSTL
ncbi:hypothetical protein ASZ90_018678 [hydrocarbon metagenome]|uniref:Metallo-beta-lactamase domain-containing protein n=1 Tax=hydrocarbon metagenome TaxID=938273 RepID=A0A0W8E5E3_9ZZZZ